MPAQAFLALNSGVPTVVQPGTTGGGTDANKIPALDANGKMTSAMLPTGVGDDVLSVVASESLSAGAFVNLWNNAGALNVRNADASVQTKPADGFVISAFSSSATAAVYMRGQNTGVSGLTLGSAYNLSTSSPGGVQTTVASVAGQLHQPLGKANAAGNLVFDPQGYFNL